MMKLLFLLCALATLPVRADTTEQYIYGMPPENNFKDNSKPWTEGQTQFPAFPIEKNLLDFSVSSTASSTYSIDPKSISIGQDNVVRYTIVIQSLHGARTVNYEGMRCDTGEYKVYGFGHDDGTWGANRYARWEPYKARSALSYRKALYEDIFCPNDLRVRSVDAAIRNLKQAQSQ